MSVAMESQHSAWHEAVTRRSFLKRSAWTALAVGGILTLPGCRSEAGDQIFRGTRSVVDHAGRSVAIPTVSQLERIYFTSGLAQIYVFTLDPTLQAGTAMQLKPKQKEFLPDSMDDLLYMGSLGDSGGQIDREMLIEKGVQLVLSISGVELSASNISEAENLQEATGIPVLLVDGSFDKISEAYRFLGDVMGCEDRAEELAVYLDQIYRDVVSAVSGLSEEEKTTLYYAEGPLGLSTEPSVSQHAKVFEIAGAYNVAQVELSASGFGMSAVSLENVIEWDPEVIVSWDAEIQGGASEVIPNSADWAGITAVKNGCVYTMPSLPFAWCDRPPGVNRWLGLQWIANLLYPDLYPVDMLEETKKFYEFVYQIEVTEEQILGMLGNSYPSTSRKPKK